MVAALTGRRNGAHARGLPLLPGAAGAMTERLGAGSDPQSPTTNQQERTTTDEADDLHAGVRRWRDAGKRRWKWEARPRNGARRMGQAAVRRRGHDVRPAGLPARRRVPVRPAHLRPLRRLMGATHGRLTAPPLVGPLRPSAPRRRSTWLDRLVQ